MSDPPNAPVAEADRPAGGLGSRFARRPSRLQVASVALVTLLAFGPIVALVFVVGSDSGPVDDLTTAGSPPTGGARIETTVINVNPTAGELQARLTIVPDAELLDDAGRPEVELVLRTNDLRGQSTYEFPAGAPLRPAEVTVALGGSSIARYPFDAYTSRLAAALSTRDGREESEPVPLVTSVRSSVSDLDVSLADGSVLRGSALAVVDLEVGRRVSTTAYAIWIMILMWGLAVSGVFIVWAVTIWGAEPPMWSYAYLVGVLFALPQLRNQLPGSPSPGTLLDFVAFYWSIAIVGVSAILTLGIWIRANRPQRAEEGPTDRPSAEPDDAVVDERGAIG